MFEIHDTCIANMRKRPLSTLNPNSWYFMCTIYIYTRTCTSQGEAGLVSVLGVYGSIAWHSRSCDGSTTTTRHCGNTWKLLIIYIHLALALDLHDGPNLAHGRSSTMNQYAQQSSPSFWRAQISSTIPRAASWTWCARIKLPVEKGIGLCMQHIGENCSAWLDHSAPCEQFSAVDAHLRPPSLDQRLTAGSIDVLLEACPANRARAHGTGFGSRVEAQLLPRLTGLFVRKLVKAIGISQDGGAVVDGGDFTV
jgi:hypothetical protein